MTNDQTIETYLFKLGVEFTTVEDGLWVIDDEMGKIVVHLDPPIVVFRTKLMDVPPLGREALFERLLVLNATEMITAAYGIEEGAVVAVASLQSENLDFNEFQAAIDAISLAMAEHRSQLRACGE